TWTPMTDSSVEVTATDENGMNTYKVTYEGALELTTYYFWTIDNVGNISEVTELTTKEIFYSINHTSWYETFADAVADASTSQVDTIYVLKDITDSSDGTVNKTVKLDTNGQTLTRTSLIEVTTDGNLEIIGIGTITNNTTTEPTINSEGTLKLSSGTIMTAGYKAVVEGTVEIAGATIEGNIYAGNGTVTLTSGTVNGNVHGGKVEGTAVESNIILQGATVNGNIYGGGDATDKVEQVNITLSSGTVVDVFGGGLNNSLVGTASIIYDGATITSGNIYGGPHTSGTVENANVTIKSGTLTNVYGGGTQGGTTINTTVNIGAGVTIEGNVYGGAHKATVGNTADNSGSTTVNIVGGTINGNVYGGSDTDPIYGSTTINIGKDAVGETTLTAGEITIGGTIYSGGHQDQTVVEDEETEEVEYFTEVSVKNGTHINIDGNETTINYSGNIFGTGENTTYEGDSSITIKNLGTSSNPYFLN
ncbi:MAG: hypothetical protein IJ272_03045, partial [Clostridia bacterium]|nr:hypothetical protein [Clostridia bacterium]